MDAVILLNKPAGMTSFQAVHQCSRILGEKKAGHTGTLDPNASGLLIILTGRYTKFLPYCMHDHKQYQAQFRLGLKSDTEDIWGRVESGRPVQEHSEEEFQAVFPQFEPAYEQVPPMYSAIKVNGRKLYQYARRGQAVERKPRLCQIQDLQIQKISQTDWALQADVSSGTYIRTLITDLAACLSEDAVMTSLVRTGIESLTLEQAVSLEDLRAGQMTNTDIRDIMDPELPQIEAADPERIRQGMAVAADCTKPLVLFTADGQILAAYEKREDGLYHCRRGLW